MKKRIIQATLCICILALAGCATKPEALKIMERDNAIYKDEGAMKQKKERKDKVTVIVSQGDYKEYAEIAKAIDAELTASLSSFAFFEFVDRSNLGALQQEKLMAGEENLDEDLVIPVQYLITAKLNTIGLPKPGDILPTATVSVDFRFYEVATKRLILSKNIQQNQKSLSQQADVPLLLKQAAQECVKRFGQTLGSRFAPPARVLQTRGNCKVARISIGTNYGLVKGVEVEFYEFIDNSAIIEGHTRDKNVIGKGRAIEVEANYAWVEVDDYEKVHVKRGDYVGVIEDQSNRLRLDNLNPLGK